MDNNFNKEKMDEKDYKENPMINAANGINQGYTGDLHSLTRGSLLMRIITSIIFIGLIALLFAKLG